MSQLVMFQAAVAQVPLSTHKLFVLGPPRLESDGQLIDVRPRKALALLVFLAVFRRPHSRDTLATLFWPDSDQQTARASLRRTLHRLGQSIPSGLIDAGTDLIQISPDAHLWIDLATYQEYLANCLPANAPDTDLNEGCVAQLEIAAQLCQDDFLAGFSLPDAPDFDEWQFFQGEELRRTHAILLEQLAHFYTQTGDFARALPFVRRRLAMDPLHEPAHRQLMQLYAWAGQQSAALRQFQECVRILSDELDAPPDDETIAVYEAIRAKRLAPPPTTRQKSTSAPPPSSLTVAGSALRASATAPLTPEPDSSEAGISDHSPVANPAAAWPASKQSFTQLPGTPIPFIGREQEVETIHNLLVNESLCRLLTLVGPGGIGKTRIAAQLVERMTTHADAQQRFSDGVLFVNLTAIDSPARFTIAIAEAAGLLHYNQDSLQAQLLEFCRRKRFLLVLDNFEHLLDASSFLSRLLNAAPALKILVTSREGLSLQEAWFYPISGMSFLRAGALNPTSVEDYESVQLFVHCARRARVDFQLQGEEEHVLRICRLVEGTPLAIELAASWLKVLPPAQIADEIETNLDILTSRHHNAPARHRSMRVVLEQSWELLPSAEQDLLMQLAYFRGGFRASAARAVADASLISLANLVEKSLIRLDEDGRYHIHELLRQFALEMLNGRPQLAQTARRRHSEYYFTFLRERDPLLTSPQQPRILSEVSEELENIQMAWQFVVSEHPEQLVGQAISSYWRIYWIRGRAREGLAIFSEALQQLPPLPDFYTDGTYTGSRVNDKVIPDDANPQLVAVYRHLLQQRALYLYFLGYLDEALADFTTCVKLAKDLDLSIAQADGLVVMGAISIWKGNQTAATGYLEQALTLFRSIRSAHGEADTLQEIARLHLAFGDYPEALRQASMTLAISRQLERPDWIGYGLITYGWASFCLGDYITARPSFADGLEFFERIGHQLGIAASLGGLGWLAWAEAENGQDSHLSGEAIGLVNQSLIILRRIGHRLQISHRLYCLAQIHLERHEYALAQQHAAEGAQLAEQIGATSFLTGNLFCMAQIAWEQGNFSAGCSYLRRGLEIAHQKELMPLMANGLYRYGLLKFTEIAHSLSGEAETLAAQRAAVTALQIVADHPAGWHVFRERARKLLLAQDLASLQFANSLLPLPTLEEAVVQTIYALLSPTSLTHANTASQEEPGSENLIPGTIAS